MKKLLQIDLSGQILCILVPILCDVLIFRDARFVFYFLPLLCGWQLLSVLYQALKRKRDQKSYGRRVYEKVLVLALAAVLGVTAYALLQEDREKGLACLFSLLYFLFYGGCILAIWYLGITVAELLKAKRHEQP